MIDIIFDKSDKGREEIATRKHHLATRLRSLLVLVDGKHSTEDLLKKVSGLGLNELALVELLESEFIQPIETASVAAPAVSKPVESAAAPVTEGILAEGENQFQALYHFYTETIKSTIGLRGFGLQLKVERCASIDDFRELRQPYLEAVLKAKGNEMARSLRDRLDQLLYLGQAPVPSTIGKVPDDPNA